MSELINLPLVKYVYQLKVKKVSISQLCVWLDDCTWVHVGRSEYLITICSIFRSSFFFFRSCFTIITHEQCLCLSVRRVDFLFLFRFLLRYQLQELMYQETVRVVKRCSSLITQILTLLWALEMSCQTNLPLTVGLLDLCDINNCPRATNTTVKMRKRERGKKLKRDEKHEMGEQFARSRECKWSVWTSNETMKHEDRPK